MTIKDIEEDQDIQDTEENWYIRDEASEEQDNIETGDTAF